MVREIRVLLKEKSKERNKSKDKNTKQWDGGIVWRGWLCKVLERGKICVHMK